MSDTRISADELSPTIPTAFREAIEELLLAWPHLEAEISIWLASAARVDLDEALALFGELGPIKKLEKIQTILLMRGEVEAAMSASRLKEIMVEYSQVRNAIAHYPCVGSSKEDPDLLHFAPFRVLRTNSEDRFVIKVIPLKDILKVAGWTKGATQILVRMRLAGL